MQLTTILSTVVPLLTASSLAAPTLVSRGDAFYFEVFESTG
jgi:hypothetical protein